MRFDSVVFADHASIAAVSCFARLRSEREAGRRTVIVALVDASGAAAITHRGLATVYAFDQFEGSVAAQGWIERLAVTIRKLEVEHVLAPLGLIGLMHSIDYFSILRSVLNVDKGRDLLFFEERPQCLVPEAVLLRLATLGVRLPPAVQFKAPRRYGSLALRLLTGVGVPPVFGGLRERSRLSASLRTPFEQAQDWDCLRALGPKLQPVVQPWTDADSGELMDLAEALGIANQVGPKKTFRRRMARHGLTAGSRTPIERYWLSLPGALTPDPINDSF